MYTNISIAPCVTCGYGLELFVMTKAVMRRVVPAGEGVAAYRNQAGLSQERRSGSKQLWNVGT